LYGELCKLSELANRPLNHELHPELLADRCAQAQTVQTLKAWKLLLK
jgi:triphosphatase